MLLVGLLKGKQQKTCRSFKACHSNLLCVGSDPVDNSVLVKVVLVSKGEGLSFPQLPHEHEGRALKVVPLLGHLGEQEEEEMMSESDWVRCSQWCPAGGSSSFHSPSSAGTAPETPRWPAAPSSTCVQSGRSGPSHLELVPDGTAACGSGSDTHTHTH